MTAETSPSRSRRRARLALAVLSACSLAALAWASFVTPVTRVVYNPSNSVPVGWYLIESASSLPVGSIVLARLPSEVAALAAQRGYLPAHIPLLKRVGAVAPQRVCITDGVVRVDDVSVAIALHADRWNRPLPVWNHCRALVEDELFLLSVTNPASFDSRYFGPIHASTVIKKARPIRLNN